MGTGFEDQVNLIRLDRYMRVEDLVHKHESVSSSPMIQGVNIKIVHHSCDAGLPVVVVLNPTSSLPLYLFQPIAVPGFIRIPYDSCVFHGGAYQDPLDSP